MNTLSLHFDGGRRAYSPGKTISGALSWNLAAPPPALEIRLLWFTQGKGTSDREIIEKISVAASSAIGDTKFRFALPHAPHSFSGTLISLCWAVEAAVLKPPAIVRLGSSDEFAERLEFIMGIEGQEIELRAVEIPETILQNQIASRFLGKKTQSAFGSESPWSDSGPKNEK